MVIQNLINIFQEDNKENKIRSVVSKDKLSIEFVIPYIFESKGIRRIYKQNALKKWSDS